MSTTTATPVDVVKGYDVPLCPPASIHPTDEGLTPARRVSRPLPPIPTSTGVKTATGSTTATATTNDKDCLQHPADATNTATAATAPAASATDEAATDEAAPDTPLELLTRQIYAEYTAAIAAYARLGEPGPGPSTLLHKARCAAAAKLKSNPELEAEIAAYIADTPPVPPKDTPAPVATNQVVAGTTSTVTSHAPAPTPPQSPLSTAFDLLPIPNAMPALPRPLTTNQLYGYILDMYLVYSRMDPAHAWVRGDGEYVNDNRGVVAAAYFLERELLMYPHPEVTCSLTTPPCFRCGYHGNPACLKLHPNQRACVPCVALGLECQPDYAAYIKAAIRRV